MRACGTEGAVPGAGRAGAGVVFTKARSPIRPDSSKHGVFAVDTHSRRAFCFLKCGQFTPGRGSSSTPPHRAATRAACGR